MSVSELMQALADAGAPMAAIIIAVRALEEKDAVLAARRAVERDRKRKQRGTVTGQSRDSHAHVQDSPSPQSPPLKTPPDPLKITPPLTPHPVVVGARAIPKFDPPEGVTADQFKAFRQQRKKPLNDHSYALLCGKLAKLAESGWPPGEMIDLAIERGWETVFEPKDRVNGSGSIDRNGSQRLGGPRPDPLLALHRAARAASGPDYVDRDGIGAPLPAGQFGGP